MAIGELIKALPKGGRPVTGERLVGRKKEIIRVLQDFFLDIDGNNMTIYGLPRIGKTSIVKEAIRQYITGNIRRENIRIAYIDLNPVKGWTVAEIYYFILNSILEEWEESVIDESVYKYIQEPLIEIKENLQMNNTKNTSLIVTIFQKFFLRCQRKGFSLRIVLDEYDSVMYSFINQQGRLNATELNAFNGAIRNIISEDRYDTRILFITRNRLSEMEPEGVSSRLTGVCGEPIMIKPFSPNEINAYWARLSLYDTEGLITSAHKEKIAYYAGGNYPYWMNLVNSILFDAICNGENENETTLKIAINIRDEYKSVLDMLDASRYLDSCEGTLRSKLIQVVLGINYNIQASDIDRLISYGVLEKKEGAYYAISPFFRDYLDFQNMQTPVWQLLGRFEKAIRHIIKYYIGSSGISIEEGIIPKGLIGELRNRCNKMCSNFGDALVSHDLIDYFPFSKYFPLFVKPYWNWFKNVYTSFNGDLKSCEEQFYFLEQCRNAEGHHNGHFLSKDIIARAEQYCVSLCEQTEVFLSKNSVIY